MQATARLGRPVFAYRGSAASTPAAAAVRRLRVVQVIDGFGHGGAERIVADYAIHLARLGFDVRVIVLQEREGEPQTARVRAAGIPVDFVPVTRLKRLGEARRLLATLRALKPDLVHAHLEFASVLTSVFRRTLGVPVVVTLHTLHKPARFSRAGARYRTMNEVAGRLADRVVCLTEEARRLAEAELPRRARLEVIANGVDLAPFRPQPDFDRAAARRSLGTPDAAPLIVCAAVLRRPKGIDRLIEAMPAVLRDLPAARLAIVGDGSERAALAAQVERLGLCGAVRLTGFRRDIPDVMRAADLFVLPTLDDALPTVVVEAMAAGLPVVASRVGGLPDMIEDGRDGILVRPGEPAALADAILRLLRDKDLAAALGAAARRRAEADFSLEGQAGHLCALYRLLIAGRGGAGPA